MLSLCTLLAWPFNEHLFACWSQCHACSHVLAILNVCLHVYKLYSLCKHLSHSKTKFYAMSCKFHHGHSTIYLKYRTYRSHPLVSHIEHMLSCWFNMSCCQVMLSVCSQVHVYTRSLAHTLIHFFEDMSTRPPSINWTFAELHYTISALNDQLLLPRVSRDWGCLLGNLHCAILESTWLTITQNSAEVSQEAISICVML